MRRKLIKGLFVLSAIVLGFIIVLLLVSSLLYSPVYMAQIITRMDSRITDYEIFPERTINKSEQPYYYDYSLDSTLLELQVTHNSGGEEKNKKLSDFIKEADTTSFIVIKNDEVIYEQYANGYDKDSINTSFSMAKSIDSLLI